MRILFDPDFEHGYWPGPLRDAAASAGETWVGPSHFAQILETALGLAGPTLSLRERAAALVSAARATAGFWSASADVDPFATARRLIHWRDTLAMSGWRGEGTEPRLQALARLMSSCPPGLPDRLQAIHRELARGSADIAHVEVCAPATDLEPLWQRTLTLLEQRGTRIVEAPASTAASPAGSDLGAARGNRFVPKGDGSLRLLRPAGPLAAAEEVAAWLAAKGCAGETLLVGSDPALDAALRRHGLPTTGAVHELCDAVPLQILPLVLELGWKTQDPQRAYELLSLSSSPVPGELSRDLRQALATWPAVDSDAWREALANGLAAIDDRDRRERVKRRLEVIWSAPMARGGSYTAQEVVRRTEMLRLWLSGRAAVAADVDASAWHDAASQCSTLLALLQRSGLTELTPAQLRHLVIEATSSAGSDSAFGAQAGIHHVGTPGGVAGPARFIVWWRFDAASCRAVARLPLTRGEREELHALGVRLTEPAQSAAAQARRWRRPLDQAREGLLLVCPDADTEGEELHPHPLWDELVSRVDAKNTRRFAERALLRTSMADLVAPQRRALLPVPAPRRDWVVPANQIGSRPKESPSSVQTLIECPFQWALKYAAKLRAPDSAQVDDGTGARVLGELLHAIMNRLFAGGDRDPDTAEVEAGFIFDHEGPRMVAALFLPGRDTRREHVRRSAMQTARTLYGLMRAGQLTVLATEQSATATAFGATFEGRVDLVLGDPPRILDLKWSGASRKRQALREGAAVQLAAYAFLERQQGHAFPPVGYFVMESQRLLTTEPGAFPGAERVDGPGPAQTWQWLQATHETVWQAVSAGRIAAPGALGAADESRPKEPCVKDGHLVIPADCRYCDYTALCGLAFEEQA